jgi:16S rRNA (cytosine967-C5)-methyltransferase
VQDVLRIGAYQLLELDRVPRYAAVETSVSLAKEAGRGAGGLVNAVLRRLAGAAGNDLPHPEPGLARRYSHPGWLVDRWVARFGEKRTEALLAHNNRRPDLVVQPARWRQAELERALAEAGIPATPAAGGGLRVAARNVTALPGYADGAFIVQDPAQAMVLEFAHIPAEWMVWDACAAPGGKALSLAQRQRVVATDASRRRLERLVVAARRIAPGLTLAVADARHPPFRHRSVDAVLIDAPCSATGTLARHPDARWKITPRRITAVSRLQAAILRGAAAVTRPGGVLVYATCSLEPEENESQVEAFLEEHGNFRRSREDFRLFPGESGTDGAYAARMERVS